jgi:hypothetical protein
VWTPHNATSAKEKKRKKEMLASPKPKSEVKNNIN